MKELIIGLIIAVLGGLAMLYAEYCYFSKDSCPIELNRGVEPELEPDKKPDEPIAPKPDKLTKPIVPKPDKKPTGTATKPLKALDFKINYLYRAGGRGEFQPLKEGSVLHSGDHYKLIFEPTKKSYVYIYQIDSSNKIFRLFPSDDFKGAAKKNYNPVKKGKPYFVPAEHKSFKLDRTVGRETLYFIVSKKPDAVFEKRYENMVLAQNTRSAADLFTARQAWHQNAETRGPVPELVADSSNIPNTWKEEGESFSVIPEHLKNLCNGCVYIVNFEHQN